MLDPKNNLQSNPAAVVQVVTPSDSESHVKCIGDGVKKFGELKPAFLVCMDLSEMYVEERNGNIISSEELLR